jgi:hypothetical protein
MPKKLDQLRKGKEFISYAEKHGATVRQGKGSYKIVQFKGEGNFDLFLGLEVKKSRNACQAQDEDQSHDEERRTKSTE